MIRLPIPGRNSIPARIHVPERVGAPRRGNLNRAPSPMVAYLTPWLSIVVASLAPSWPVIASVPLMPPLGFLTLLAWRQLHPGLLPVWAGLPLGLFDDLISGQPAGSGVLLWSVALLGLEAIELRWPWRHFLVEWAVSAAFIAAYLVIAGVFANGLPSSFADWPPGWLVVVAPQILVSILVYPLLARLVAWLDRLRLTRFRKLA
jgi:rod shape-determining protein MreD